jgi:hypothetical protein
LNGAGGKSIKILLISFFILSAIAMIGAIAGTATAANVVGTWTSTTTGEGYIDSFHTGIYYDDVVLTLQGGSTISGTFTITVRSVDVLESGWGVENAVGYSNTGTINEGSTSGSSVTLPVTDNLMGNTYTLTLTENNGRMTGSGSYVDNNNVIHSWDMDVTRTGGAGGSGLGSFDLSSLAIPAAIVGVTGAVASISASVRPPPVRPRPVSVRHIPPPPYNVPSPSHQPQSQYSEHATHLPQPMQFTPLPPGISVGWPLPPQGTNGLHLVPEDAPSQPAPNNVPPHSSTTCPFCGTTTLSPFRTGWYCTNAMCPARRGNFTGGLRHEFVNMTWWP